MGGRFHERFIPFCVVHPRYRAEALEELREYLGGKGWRGVKLHPVEQLYPADAASCCRVAEVAALHKVPVAVHSSQDDFAHPARIGRLAGRFPDVTFITVHPGEIRRSFGQVFALRAEELRKPALDSIRMYFGLQRLIGEFGLNSLSIKCQPELSRSVGCLCIPLSLLCEEGGFMNCEGDIHGLLSMIFLRSLTGRDVAFADLVNAEGDTLWFSSCGFISPSLVDGSMDIKRQVPAIGEAGVVFSGAPMTGSVTLCRPERLSMGVLKLSNAGANRLWKRGVYFHDYGGKARHHGFSYAHTFADIDLVLDRLEGATKELAHG